MPMRVYVGIAQFRGDAIFEPLGNKVFEPLGFVVNFVPRVSKHIVKEALEQPVMAKNFESSPGARRRQDHSMMLLVFDEGVILRCELLKHPGDRCRPNTKMLSKSVAADALLLLTAQLKNSL